MKKISLFFFVLFFALGVFFSFVSPFRLSLPLANKISENSNPNFELKLKGKVSLLSVLQKDLEFEIKQNKSESKNGFLKVSMAILSQTNFPKIPNQTALNTQYGEIKFELSDEFYNLVNSNFDETIQIFFDEKTGGLRKIELEDVFPQENFWEIGNIKQQNYIFVEPFSERELTLIYSNEEKFQNLETFRFETNFDLKIGKMTFRGFTIRISQNLELDLLVEKETGLPVFLEVHSAPDSNFDLIEKIVVLDLETDQKEKGFVEYVKSIGKISKIFKIIKYSNWIFFALSGLNFLIFALSRYSEKRKFIKKEN